MKLFNIAIVLLFIWPFGFLEKDKVQKDRQNIYDENGQYSGFAKPNVLYDDRMDVHDKDGKNTGYIKEDILFKGRYNYYKIEKED